jgi:hypothetical protein
MVETRFWIWIGKMIFAYSDCCFSAPAVNATVRGVRGNVSGGKKMYPGQGRFFEKKFSRSPELRAWVAVGLWASYKIRTSYQSFPLWRDKGNFVILNPLLRDAPPPHHIKKPDCLQVLLNPVINKCLTGE